MQNNIKFSRALLALRLSIFLVMFMWTLDKFIRPEHASQVFQHFYFLPDLGSTIVYIFGAIEMLILIGFLLGIKKQLTYGAVLIFHLISTLSSYKQYLAPFADGANLLFFAAWPMLAACYALYSLRDQDTCCICKTC